MLKDIEFHKICDMIKSISIVGIDLILYWGKEELICPKNPLLLT